MTTETKNIILTNLENTRDFNTIYEGLGLDKYEPILVADKELANRFRIERSDNGIVLKNNRAVSKSFKLLSNKKILEIGNALLTNNENLIITSASSKNNGEELFLTAKIKDFVVPNEIKEIKGIGEIEPNLFISIPVIGGINFITTAFQIYCTNQVIALSSNPLTKATSIEHRDKLEEQIDKLLLNYQNIEKDFNDILNKLAVFKEFNLDDEDYSNYLSTLFKTENIEIDKPKLYKSLKDKYNNAPNSDPGNLLGAYNSITNYIATNNYKNSDLKYFSKLPTSNQYNLSKNAFKLADMLVKVGNTNLLF